MEPLAKLLQSYKGKSALLLAHHNADPDAVCSALALASGLKQLDFKTKIGVVDSVSKLSKTILDNLGKEVAINPSLDADLIILLDTSTEGQLSDFAEKFNTSNAVKIMIDHHAVQEKSLKVDHKFVDETSSSTAVMVYSLLKELNVSIEKETALAILAGITAETAHLRFAKLGDLKAITELLENNKIEFSEILNMLNTPLDISEKIARFKSAKRLKLYRISDYLIVTSNILSFEASAARSFIKTGADLAAVVAKRKNEIRISLRASNNFVQKTGIDLSKDLIPKIVKIIDGSGSGHKAAAGANGKALNKGKDALESIVKFVGKKLGEGAKELE